MGLCRSPRRRIFHNAIEIKQGKCFLRVWLLGEHLVDFVRSGNQGKKKRDRLLRDDPSNATHPSEGSAAADLASGFNNQKFTLHVRMQVTPETVLFRLTDTGRRVVLDRLGEDQGCGLPCIHME